MAWIPKKPYSEKIWFSPSYAVRELSQSVLTENNKTISRNKEAWICAVSLLCRSKVQPAEWWIQIPKNDPPDVLAMNVIPREDGPGNSLSVLPVEVFEISENDQDRETIEQSIERKLMGKDGLRPKDYLGTLVVGFVRRQQIFNHKAVADYINKINPKVGALCLIVSEEDSTNFSFIGILPHFFKYKCHWGEMCKTTPQNDFISLERSTKLEPRITEYTNDTLTLIP